MKKPGVSNKKFNKKVLKNEEQKNIKWNMVFNTEITKNEEIEEQEEEEK